MRTGRRQQLHQNGPFVVTVASEKGGVGKTTLATNLAVYLKALDEDLPVTIASFDNHFSVDNMFAIGSHRGQSVAGLLAGQPPEQLAQLGEYGVAFLASARQLAPPEDEASLRRLFGQSRLPGILILDTRPILDPISRSALQAADLVLTPIKDRASLVNAAALQTVLGESGEQRSRLWLVPSLIDGRLRLRDNLGMHAFLRGSAEERGYQVAPVAIAKSPKVESLASGLTSRIYPVLTHARGTLVHGQFRRLAEFVAQQLAALDGPRAAQAPEAAAGAEHSRLLAAACPLCGAPAPTTGGYFQALHGRRRGLLHAACLDRLERPEETADAAAAVLVLDLLAEREVPLQLLAFAADGRPLGRAPAPPGWQALLLAVCERPLEELYRERLLLGLEPRTVAAWHQFLPPLRRRVLAALGEFGATE